MLGMNAILAVETNVGEAAATLDWRDWAVVALYICGVVGLGLWVGLRRKSSEGAGYFLADKSLTWPVIGLALFSTNISTIHLVSLAQSGYQTGLAMGNFEWMAAFTLICLSLFFAPFFLRSKVATLPDFLEKRYCRPCRDWLAAISILSAVVVHLGFTLYTGVVVLEGFLLNDLVADPVQWRLVTLCVIGGLAGLYTIVGGLMAVVLTESLDTIVLLVGAICITIFGFHAVGGWDGLETAMSELTEYAANENAEVASGMARDHVPANTANHLTIVRGHGDASGLPWYAVLFGYPVIGIWYWCTDQTIVQRVLGAKNENHARVGPLFAGFIKILPVFIFVLPGVMCLALIHQGALPELPLKDGVPNTEATLAVLIKGLLPVGMKGVMAAALLAALMSTVSGALNSIATLFSYDLFKRWRPTTSDRSLVLIGRIVTVVALAGAIAWSQYLDRFDSIFAGLQEVIGYIAPPITALFLWGVFFRGITARAALVTAWFGTLMGVATFVLSWTGCVAQWESTYGFRIPLLVPAVFLFIACSVVLFLVSKSPRLTMVVALVGIAVGLAGSAIIGTGLLESLATGTADSVENAKGEMTKLVYPGWLSAILIPGFVFAMSSPVVLLIMLLVPEQAESADRDSLVWKSIFEPLRGDAWRGIGNFRVLTVVLFVTMLVFYWWFS